MKDNFYENLIKILKTNEQYISDEGSLLKNKIFEDAMKLDTKLINLLFENENIRERLFRKVGENYIFDKVEFGWIVNNKEFLPDSFTKFSNKIGLGTTNSNFIINSSDVVLNFPYKDCILEFDSTDENENRHETFFNEVLSKNQIDTLISPKVFTNIKEFCKTRTPKSKNIFSDKENLIIKGNNLLAMNSLLAKFERKVKCMYWDILYNTNSDIVPYNDSFKHSSWLIMMKNRLEVAIKLLKDDGVICLQCDDNEQAYLTVLCDEIFGRNNHVNTICVKMSELKGFKMGNVNNKYPKLKEYILIYAKNKDLTSIDIEYVKKNNIEQYTKYYNKRITNIDEPPEKWALEAVDENYDKIGHAEEMVYLVTRDSSSSLDLPINKFTKVTNRDGKTTVLLNTGSKIYTALFLSDYLKEPIGDIWMDISTININKESSVQLPNGKKPEKLLKRIISSLSEEGDIILDAYFGTGTTGAVAMKMGRQFIGIEQLNSHIEKSIKRLQEVIDGDSSGISSEVNWNGGGGFTYLELMTCNQRYIDLILKTKDKKELMTIFFEMKENAFINDKIDLKSFDKNIEIFNELKIEEQKQLLIELLDKNMLYVNYSDMNDENYCVSNDDKRFNNSFYGDKKDE